MSRGYLDLPGAARTVLRRASVPAVLLGDLAASLHPDRDGLALVDLELAGGRVARVAAAAPGPGVDLDRAQVWPAFVDLHTHLDKGHILPRAPNPDGTVYGAVRTVAADRERHWSADDVRRRFEFGLRAAYAHGTCAIRTHLDCEPPQAAITWPVFAELRAAWAGRVELQGVGKFPLELYLTPEGGRFAELVAAHGGVLGAVTVVPGVGWPAALPRVEAALDALMALAARHALEVDLHVDESGDPAAATLALVARATLRHRMQGRVVCGHCCSLAVQPAEVAAEVIDLCAAAGLAVVTLPMINQYLQARGAGVTPRWRGVTLVHELARRGVPVAVASDNCRDPFFAYGDHDMLEVFAQSVRIAHLDLPSGPWTAAATAVPARLMGLRVRGVIEAGSPADLVIFRARSMSELLSRPQADRVVLRSGRPIDTTLPDHRELDPLF
jgi:cytosine deaminase